MPDRHTWFTAEDIAALLDAHKHGDHWRAACPAHRGENHQALSIKEGIDSHGNPCTLLKCFAHDCDIRDICAALGIELRHLFCIHPDYARATKYAPRAHGPGIAALKTLDAPVPEEVAQCLLAEMLIEDTDFLVADGVRKALWHWGKSSLSAKTLFTQAFLEAGYHPTTIWKALETEYGGDYV